MNLNLIVIKIIKPKKSNIIVGCIYKYPSMEIGDFNNKFLNNPDKVSKERKLVFLAGEFNINLIVID